MNKTSRRAPRARAPAIAAALRVGPKAPRVRPPKWGQTVPPGLDGPQGQGDSMRAIVAPVVPTRD